jgi:hypothetical protein
MMFQEFRNSLGENPVGSNAEITKALLGDNLKQVRLTLPKGLIVNQDGEMCDARGIPLFFPSTVRQGNGNPLRGCG